MYLVFKLVISHHHNSHLVRKIWPAVIQCCKSLHNLTTDSEIPQYIKYLQIIKNCITDARDVVRVHRNVFSNSNHKDKMEVTYAQLKSWKRNTKTLYINFIVKSHSCDNKECICNHKASNYEFSYFIGSILRMMNMFEYTSGVICDYSFIQPL
jgi:hypothetical protein